MPVALRLVLVCWGRVRHTSKKERATLWGWEPVFQDRPDMHRAPLPTDMKHKPFFWRDVLFDFAWSIGGLENFCAKNFLQPPTNSQQN